jgi:hypothetical protein
MKRFLLLDYLAVEGMAVDGSPELEIYEYRNFSIIGHDFLGIVLYASGY